MVDFKGYFCINYYQFLISNFAMDGFDIYVIMGILPHFREVAIEVAARSEAEAMEKVKEHEKYRNITDLTILGKLKSSCVLRQLPYVPSKEWIEERFGQ